MGALTLTAFLDRIYAPGHLGIRPGSINQMAIGIRLLNRWAGREITLAELSDDLLIQFLNHYAQTRARPTVNAKRRIFLSLWRCAHRRGDLPHGPGEIPRMREYIRQPEAWEQEELGRIIVEAQREEGEIAFLPARRWWTSLILSVYDVGGRIGAVRAVCQSDVDIRRQGLLLRAEHQKTGRDEWCPLSEQTVAACAGIMDSPRLLMWPWCFSREWLDERFRQLLRRAGVRFGRQAGGLWNKLRRTAGTLIEANGGDGSRHLGNSRRVFEAHYLDQRIAGKGQLDKLPRPKLPNDPQMRLF